MRIQLSFETPRYVSANAYAPELLNVTFFGFFMFQGQDNLYFVPEIMIEKKIPQQESQALIELVESSAAVMSAATLFTAASTTLVNLLMAGPLNSLLSSMKSIQLMGH